jgi:hypothetical protein
MYAPLQSSLCMSCCACMTGPHHNLSLFSQVPEMSAFLLMTIFPQIPCIMFFTTFQEHIFPIDRAAGWIMLAFLVSRAPAHPCREAALVVGLGCQAHLIWICRRHKG